MAIETVRIPELDYGLPLVTILAPEDRIPLWLSGLDKTVYVELKDIGAVIGGSGGGGGTPVPLNPIIIGKRMVITIPVDLEGQDTVSIPAIAGQDFELSLEGRPLYKRDPNDIQATDEYEVLSGGGFRLIGFTLSEGSRYGLDLYSLIQQNNNVANGSLFTGVLPISSNRTLSTSDLNKLYQLRGGSSALTVTLQSLGLVPDNQVLVFETSINNTKPHKLQTTAGQFMYVNGQGLTSLYLHPGEVLWLLKGDDGYYVISDYAKYYSLVGKPVDSYSVEADEVLLDGSLLTRADYPRLWQRVQTFGASLVDDATWQTASVTLGGKTIDNPYRGCWSTGDGSTTFRVPDWMNAFARVVKSTSGSDAERYLNKPGGWQAEDAKYTDMGGQDDVLHDGTPTGLSYSAGSAQFYKRSYGAETRPGNIGVLKVTKR